MAHKVLIVEDSPTMRQLLRFALQRVGPVDIVEADDGVKGLKELNQAEFDLVLLDINMPLMDGLKLLRLIRENPASKTLPVVIITTEGKDDVISRAQSLGVNAYITKPIRQADIVATVKNLLPT